MAADEANALSNIHLLLDALESQQHSTVVSLNAKEVGVSRDVCSVKIPGHIASAVPGICKISQKSLLVQSGKNSQHACLGIKWLQMLMWPMTS